MFMVLPYECVGDEFFTLQKMIKILFFAKFDLGHPVSLSCRLKIFLEFMNQKIMLQYLILYIVFKYSSNVVLYDNLH